MNNQNNNFNIKFYELFRNILYPETREKFSDYLDILLKSENLEHFNHKETIPIHICLSLAKMLQICPSKTYLHYVMLLHDIGKLRCYDQENRNFQKHEYVTKEEISLLVPESDKDFNKILLLVRLHMLPYDNKADMMKSVKKRIEEYGLEVSAEEIITDLLLINYCDRAAMLDSNLTKNQKKALKKAIELLNHI